MNNSEIRGAGSNLIYSHLYDEAGVWSSPGFQRDYAMRRMYAAYGEVGLLTPFKAGIRSSMSPTRKGGFEEAEIRAIRRYGDNTPAFWAWYEGWMLAAGSF